MLYIDVFSSRIIFKSEVVDDCGMYSIEEEGSATERDETGGK